MTLKTPYRGRPDPIGAALSAVFGSGADDIVAPGVIVTGHWSPNLHGWAVGDGYGDMPLWDELAELKIHSTGVCDGPSQLIERFGGALEGLATTVCVFMVHVPKVPGETGGWRWHKWGAYVGDGTPTTEYLADEPEFDAGVYTYHVYRVLV